MILIKNGRVIDPATNTDEVLDVLIEGDRIVKTGKHISVSSEEKMPAEAIKNEEITDAQKADAGADNLTVLDAEGLVVAPGLVDTHVHFRDPGLTYKEDIYSGAKAAAKGGFTTVVALANTKPPVDTPESVAANIKKGKETGVHVLQAACVTKEMKGKELTDFEALKAAGAAAFTDDGVPVMDEKILLEAMKKAKELDTPIALHEEDPLFIKSPGVHMGKVSEAIGYGGASRTAEDVMVARDVILALETGACVCIQHISSGNSVELVRTAKKLGADVHAEATPHHFTLTEEAVLQYGTNARMNPPLRTEADRLQIIEGLKDGTIDVIVTDHAPHSEEEKNREMGKAMSGITGLETSLGLGIRSLVQPGHLSLMKLMELMSLNPSKLYRLTPVSITPGAKADLVIFGENETWTVKEFASKAVNSPFVGWELPGRVHWTICDGKIAYEST